MTNDQLLAFLRQFMTMFGTVAGTWMIKSGYVTSAQWTSIVAFVGTTLVPIGVSLWASWHVHSMAGRLEAVGRMDDSVVAHVKLADTPEGHALAAAVPSSKVAVS